MSVIIDYTECIILALNPSRIRHATWASADHLLGDLNEMFHLPIVEKEVSGIDRAELQEIVDELKQKAVANSRARLLLFGAYLEDHVTVCALQALAEGFDVYLLSDLITARERRHARVLEFRLYQAGAVPTTLSQFLYQWLACEPDGARKAKLKSVFRLSNCER